MEHFETSTIITHSTLITEPINLENESENVIEHLNLESFKLNPCSISNQHNHKFCPFYHNTKDRKRPGSFFSADLCSFIENNKVCIYGDRCTKSHNRVEQLYRPEKYKTKFCSYYPNNLGKCDYGKFCSFAHSENDILVELIHNLNYDPDFYIFYFKTVWCPFNLTGHDKSKCVYAHNWQDFRRKPHLYAYEPQSCPNWKSTDFILNYSDGCPMKESCKMCHGWKELEYHPLLYKTKECNNNVNCLKKSDCPFYHFTEERRQIQNGVVYKFFEFKPKNRIISNTFKRISPVNSHIPTKSMKSINTPNTFSRPGPTNTEGFSQTSLQTPQLNAHSLPSFLNDKGFITPNLHLSKKKKKLNVGNNFDPSLELNKNLTTVEENQPLEKYYMKTSNFTDKRNSSNSPNKVVEKTRSGLKKLTLESFDPKKIELLEKDEPFETNDKNNIDDNIKDQVEFLFEHD